ncbi:MAG: hypothetical protein N4A62_05295 [Marinisporobacter sp.]|nr:hypothetical protein [Marinisporobacter sp.]
MKIFEANSNVYYCRVKKNNMFKLENKVEDKFEMNNIDTITANNKDDVVVAKDLTKKYNVRNSTFEEIKEIANKLYENDEISLRLYSIMVLDESKLPIPENEKKFLLNRYHGSKQDWIEIYENHAKMCARRGDMNSYNQNIRVIKLLKQIEK